jgi:hypothetical protein
VSVFEKVVETVKKEFVEKGAEPIPHVVLVKDGKPSAVFALHFTKETKPLVFQHFLPMIIRAVAPESCVFVLPSVMRTIDEKTGEPANPEDVVIIHELTPVETRAVIVRKSEIIRTNEHCKIETNLLRPVQEALKEVWAGII